jgi:hypothetical protein
MSNPDKTRHFCANCKGEFTVEKPRAPLRIFLSYGHDSNEELVTLIKTDLEARGHKVWFDKSEIKFNDDWRRAITDGIIESHRVLSFLSKHSTRDPGVCLDEIGIAIGVKGGNIQTVLVESETEVRPPASVSHVQWLDMHDWKDRRAEGDPAWHEWYQAKLDEIVRVVESEESRQFAGEIQKLSEYLKPISSDSRISVLLRKGFVGRKWLFDAIEAWRNADDRTSRLFWIVGDPGVGKSAFAAHLTHFGRDKVVAAQFVEWDKLDHRNAHHVVRSLAFQLATRLPDYRRLLLTLPEIADLDGKKPNELFDYLLANPLRSVIGGGRERYLLLVDALDEAGEGERNPLVEMLARNIELLPDWLGVVVTSRPESAVKTPLQQYNPHVLDTRTEANQNDIREYLRRALDSHLTARPDPDRIIERILDKSEGVFLYVECFCEEVHQGYISLDLPEQFPQGLGGIFCQYFQRQFPNLEKFRKDVRPALRAILAAREPLPVEILQRLFHWQDEELRDFTRTLGSLFPVTREAAGEGIRPYHKSLADWLADAAKAGAYFVSVTDGHRLLADYGWAHISRECLFSSDEAATVFFCKNLPFHLQLAGQWDRLLECVANSETMGGSDSGLRLRLRALVECCANQALLQRLAPAQYGVNYDKGTFTGISDNALTPERLVGISPDEQSDLAWTLAHVFAAKARHLLQERSEFFCRYRESFRSSHFSFKQFLQTQHCAAYSQYRDIHYSFVRFSGLAAEYAVTGFDNTANRQKALRTFLDENHGLLSFHRFLANNACSDGWSGQLESDAWPGDQRWKELEQLAADAPG